jgi:hypothetical protein
MCSPLFALDISPQVLSNDQTIKAFVGLGDMATGVVGPVAEWRSHDDADVWSAGIRGQLDLTSATRALLTDVFQVPAGWFEILDKVGARAYVGDEIKAVDMQRDVQASNYVFGGAALGPLVLEAGYELFEQGRIRAADGVIAESGLQWFAGLRWMFRF